MPDVLVIGAGLNGLVTAAVLAKAGRRVLVLERRDVVGGSAVTEEFAPGFRVDACAHDVGGLPPRVAKAVGFRGDGVIRPDPATLTPLSNGRHLALSADPRKAAAAIGGHSPADAAKWEEFCVRMSRLAGFLDALYAVAPPAPTSTRAADLLALLGLGRRFRGLGHSGMIDLLRILPMSAAELLDDWFESDAVKGTLGASAVTGLLQGPRSGGTAFVLLHHLAANGGAPGAFRARAITRGGIGNFARGLAEAARRHGAEIRTGADVARVTVAGGRATGVVLGSGETIPAALVVSSADPRRTFLDLVGPDHLDPEFLHAVRHIKCRGAVAKVHLALAELPKLAAGADGTAALAGAISISPSLDYLERAYDDAKHGGISRHPYCEARIPTLHDPSLAPPGKHVMSVWVQYAPYHLTGGWTDGQRAALGDAVVGALAEHAPNLPGAVLHREVLTPPDLERRYGLPEGSLYHGELTLDQILFMRPVAGWSRYRTPIPGLWLGGSGTHPGGAVTGGPGFNAARRILAES